MIGNNNKTIAIVSHDAGGAEVLSSFVRRTAASFLYCLDGPALGIFRRKDIAVENLPLATVIAEADLVLCSASWQSDLEYRAVQQARRSGKRVVVFLDHWVNYRGRLVRDADSLLPNEIWVGDSDAYALARRELPEVPIQQRPNPFTEDLAAAIGESELSIAHGQGAVRVLYVAEIIDGFSKARGAEAAPYGYTEETALRYFLDHLSHIFESVETVTIRPHPAEPPDKYDWAAARYGAAIRTPHQDSLLDAIRDCDVVVGCESMAMVIALQAGRRVICSVPPGGKPSVLPQAKIESLQALLSERCRQ